MSEPKNIVIKNARVNNLKNISLTIPRNQFVVISGVSGSGKSSLAFDTIFAEGQRKYIESLSSYARQFLKRMDKPNVDFIEGLSPAIANKINESNIKLFTIGVGSEEGSKLLLSDGNFKKDNEGKEVITKLNPSSLKEAANDTGGKYFEISNNINQTDNLIAQISNIKGDIIESKVIDVSGNKYFYFLLGALFLMLLDFSFNLKIIRI